MTIHLSNFRSMNDIREGERRTRSYNLLNNNEEEEETKLYIYIYVYERIKWHTTKLSYVI